MSGQRRIVVHLRADISAAKVARTFYRQSKDIDRYLSTSDSMSRTIYRRILIMASLDIFCTLPVGIVSIVLVLNGGGSSTLRSLPFYPGWKATHAHWAPYGLSYEQAASARSGVLLVSMDNAGGLAHRIWYLRLDGRGSSFVSTRTSSLPWMV